MPVNKYLFHISLKTRILNLFRKLLTIPFIEDYIVERSSRNPSMFWVKVVPPEYTYPKGSIRNVRRDGVRFCLDISDNLEHSIYFFGLMKSGFDVASKYIEKSEVIFDIGANIGTASIIMSMMNPHAKIYSFEPHPVTFKSALEISGLNKIGQVIYNNIGLGEESGKKLLFEVNSNNAGMNRMVSGGEDYPSIEVRVEKMDNFVSDNQINRLDFIKIDVEGYEYAVLKGGSETLKKFHPVLYIEIDDNNLKDCGSSAAEVINLIRTYGYNTFSKADNGERIHDRFNFTNCHFDVLAICN